MGASRNLYRIPRILIPSVTGKAVVSLSEKIAIGDFLVFPVGVWVLIVLELADEE